MCKGVFSMARRSLGLVSLGLALVLLAQVVAGPLRVSHALAAHPGAAVSAAQRAAIASAYGQLPLAFEVNAGQDADPAVRFLAHGGGYTLALTPTQALLALSQPATAAFAGPSRPRLPGQPALFAGPSGPR